MRAVCGAVVATVALAGCLDLWPPPWLGPDCPVWELEWTEPGLFDRLEGRRAGSFPVREELQPGMAMAHPTLDAAWRSYNLTYIERRFPHADRHEGVEFFMALSSAYVSFVAPETISRERLGSMLVVFVGNVLDIEPDALQALFEHALANETEDYQVTQFDFGGRRKLWMLDYEADLPLPLRLRPLPADLGDALESARREHATVVVRIEENRYSFALSHRSILLGEPEGTISVDTLDDVSIRQHGLAATGEEARNKVRGWFGEAELPPPSFQEARTRQACE